VSGGVRKLFFMGTVRVWESKCWGWDVGDVECNECGEAMWSMDGENVGLGVRIYQFGSDVRKQGVEAL
jgi:hypothetical protein